MPPPPSRDTTGWVTYECRDTTGWVTYEWPTSWTYTTSTTATITYDTTWANWTANNSTTITYNTPRVVPLSQPRNTPRGVTAEQIAAIDRDRVQRQEGARQRAREILLEHLDATQRQDLMERECFLVRSSTGRLWRIKVGTLIGNVDLVVVDDRGEIRLASYCAHPAGDMPKDDHHLAQKLALEADEQSFINVANVHYVRDGYEEQIPRRQRAA